MPIGACMWSILRTLLNHLKVWFWKKCSLNIFPFAVWFTACPVNFEFQNYTILTSKCKGPLYLSKLCCPALKDFACQFADDINDLSTDCASTMFSYINLYGKYPPGLFSSECREGKLGLECPALPPSASQSDKSKGCRIVSKPFRGMILIAAFLVLLRFMGS